MHSLEVLFKVSIKYCKMAEDFTDRSKKSHPDNSESSAMIPDEHQIDRPSNFVPAIQPSSLEEEKRPMDENDEDQIHAVNDDYLSPDEIHLSDDL